MTGMLLTVALCAVIAQTPQPFPRPGAPKPANPPATTAPSTAQPARRRVVAPPSAPVNPAAAPSEASLGVQLYPGAEFLASYDAGKGQRYYLFGTNTPFAEIVNYYRT